MPHTATEVLAQLAEARKALRTIQDTWTPSDNDALIKAMGTIPRIDERGIDDLGRHLDRLHAYVTTALASVTWSEGFIEDLVRTIRARQAGSFTV